MGLIRLTGLEFFAYHGYHAAERDMGNRYRIDVEITTDFGPAAERDELAGTVNYEQVFALVRDRMATPARLLEHIGYELCQAIYARFGQIARVQVEVTKFNPPLGGVCHAASVTVCWPDDFAAAP